MVDKVTVVRYSFAGEKFELLVKPDPALDRVQELQMRSFSRHSRQMMY